MYSWRSIITTTLTLLLHHTLSQTILNGNWEGHVLARLNNFRSQLALGNITSNQARDMNSIYWDDKMSQFAEQQLIKDVDCNPNTFNSMPYNLNFSFLGRYPINNSVGATFDFNMNFGATNIDNFDPINNINDAKLLLDNIINEWIANVNDINSNNIGYGLVRYVGCSSVQCLVQSRPPDPDDKLVLLCYFYAATSSLPYPSTDSQGNPTGNYYEHGPPATNCPPDRIPNNITGLCEGCPSKNYYHCIDVPDTCIFQSVCIGPDKDKCPAFCNDDPGEVCYNWDVGRNEIECQPQPILPTKQPTITPTLIPTSNPTTINEFCNTLNINECNTNNNCCYFGNICQDCRLIPTNMPTISPTTPRPTNPPTLKPTNTPSLIPSLNPTKLTNIPTLLPSLIPSISPSLLTKQPTIYPTFNPSLIPTIIPTKYPSISPTVITVFPTLIPSVYPSYMPSIITKYPSVIPSMNTFIPTTFPTMFPSNIPTIYTDIPTKLPTIMPTKTTNIPSLSPLFTQHPTINPTYLTNIPTNNPTNIPTLLPTNIPTINPTIIPTNIPTNVPTLIPTNIPTMLPTNIPTINPISNTLLPTNNPTTNTPTINIITSNSPTIQLTTNKPTNKPTLIINNICKFYYSKWKSITSCSEICYDGIHTGYKKYERDVYVICKWGSWHNNIEIKTEKCNIHKCPPTTNKPTKNPTVFNIKEYGETVKGKGIKYKGKGSLTWFNQRMKEYSHGYNFGYSEDDSNEIDNKWKRNDRGFRFYYDSKKNSDDIHY